MGLIENLLSKKKKQAEDPLKSGALKQLEKLKHKKFFPQLIEELNKIFRIYLREKYKIKQSLTYEEIAIEIRNKKIKKHKKNNIISLGDKINNIEFKSAEFNRDVLNLLIEEFKELIISKIKNPKKKPAKKVKPKKKKVVKKKLVKKKARAKKKPNKKTKPKKPTKPEKKSLFNKINPLKIFS